MKKYDGDLVGGLEHFLFFHILGIIIPTWLVVSNIFFNNIWDNPSHWLIFFKMVKTTNQICFQSPTMCVFFWDFFWVHVDNTNSHICCPCPVYPCETWIYRHVGYFTGIQCIYIIYRDLNTLYGYRICIYIYVHICAPQSFGCWFVFAYLPITYYYRKT